MQVDLNLRSRGGAAGHQSSADAHAAHGMLPQGGADVFKDDIDTLAASDLFDFFGNILNLIVDREVCRRAIWS